MVAAVRRSGSCSRSGRDQWCLERVCQPGSHGSAEASCLVSPQAMSQVLYWALQNFSSAIGFYVEIKIHVHITVVYTNTPSSFNVIAKNGKQPRN